MRWVLFIISVIVIFAIYKKNITKIDANYEKAMKTHGRANYLRDNYPILVLYIESIPSYEIEFERADMIRYTNTSNRIKRQIVIQHLLDTVCVIYVLDNVVLKEWRLKEREFSDKQMADEVRSYLMYKE